jgi:hypothetical protein
MVQDAPSANTEFPTIAKSRLIIARATDTGKLTSEARLLIFPTITPSEVVHSPICLGAVSLIPKTQRWRLT